MRNYCPTFPSMSIKILQKHFAWRVSFVCVKHANFIEIFFLPSIYNVKMNPSKFCVYVFTIRKEGKEGKKQTNRKTWGMQRLQNLFFCVFHNAINSHSPSFLTLKFNGWDMKSVIIAFNFKGKVLLMHPLIHMGII